MSDVTEDRCTGRGCGDRQQEVLRGVPRNAAWADMPADDAPAGLTQTVVYARDRAGTLGGNGPCRRPITDPCSVVEPERPNQSRAYRPAGGLRFRDKNSTINKNSHYASVQI